MKRKITLLTSIYVLSALFSISASAYDIEINGLQYDVVKKAKQASLVYCNKYEAPKDIEIPSTITFENVECDVTTIKFGSFLGCSDITSVKIPNSITSIEGKAFYNCYSIESIVIPNSITSIEDETFWACKNLKSVTLSENLTNIGDYAFSCCWNMVSLTIPNSVKSIGKYAFWKCANLTYLTLPNSLETIEEGAFLLCESLGTIEIPSSVTSIKGEAFKSCKKLSSVKIPNSITSIGISAFGFCDELKDFYCYAENVPTTSTYAFNESYIEYATLHVPASAIDEYKKAEPWCNFGNIVAIENTGIKSVKDRGIAIQSSAGIINISGLENNEKVCFYGIDGKALGSATAINGTTSFSAQSGTVVIAKIGKESIKIAVE